MVHSMRKRRYRKGMMVLKLHLEKAHDRLSWDAILTTLMDTSLPNYLDSLIMKCVSYSSIRALWNRKSIEKFYLTREILQGNSLLHIYLLCVWKDWLTELMLQLLMVIGNLLKYVRSVLIYRIYFFLMILSFLLRLEFSK